MPRYEGMDEILKGVSKHLTTRSAPAVEEVAAPRPLQPHIDPPFVRAEAALTRLNADAEKFRDLLAAEAVQTLSQEEHDHLLALLGNVLQELWSCEAALQRVAPYD